MPSSAKVGFHSVGSIEVDPYPSAPNFCEIYFASLSSFDNPVETKRQPSRTDEDIVQV